MKYDLSGVTLSLSLSLSLSPSLSLSHAEPDFKPKTA